MNLDNIIKLNASWGVHPFYKIARQQLDNGVEMAMTIEKQLADVPCGTVKDKIDIKNASTPLSREQVNHPAHYNQGRIEVIDVIESKRMNFHLGNAFKYVSRAGKKDPKKYIEDLQKALWYLERLMEEKDVGRITTMDFVLDQNCTGVIAILIRAIVEAHEQWESGDGNIRLTMAICTLKELITAEKAKRE